MVRKKNFLWIGMIGISVFSLSVMSMTQQDKDKEQIIALWRLGHYKKLIIPSIGPADSSSPSVDIGFDSSGKYLIQTYNKQYQVITVKTGHVFFTCDISKYVMHRMLHGDIQKIKKTMSSKLPEGMYYRSWFLPLTNTYQDCYYGDSGVLVGRCTNTISKKDVYTLQDNVVFFDSVRAAPFMLVPMQELLVGNHKSLVLNKQQDMLAVLLSDHTVALISPHKPFVCVRQFQDVIVKCFE